mgnify:CR=1 FL=1
MSHKKNNRIFVILIIIICIFVLLGLIYNGINKKTVSNNSNDSSYIPKPAPMEVQSLIELQRDKWPSALLEIDCLKESTTDSKKYCLESQEILKKIYNK